MNHPLTRPSRATRARSSIAPLAILFGPLAAAVMSYACIKPSHVASALEVAQVACILTHEQVDDESVLAKACDISDALVPEIRKILFARKAAAKEKAKLGAPAGCPNASAATPVAPSASASSPANPKH